MEKIRGGFFKHHVAMACGRIDFIRITRMSAENFCKISVQMHFECENLNYYLRIDRESAKLIIEHMPSPSSMKLMIPESTSAGEIGDACNFQFGSLLISMSIISEEISDKISIRIVILTAKLAEVNFNK